LRSLPFSISTRTKRPSRSTRSSSDAFHVPLTIPPLDDEHYTDEHEKGKRSIFSVGRA
jgi:hypothetical protein